MISMLSRSYRVAIPLYQRTHSTYPGARRLEGKVALITGGARGMGASHVQHFLSQGARVVFGDLRYEQGQLLEAKLTPEFKDSCKFVLHDVRSEKDWASAVQTTKHLYGKLDILVNNAGIFSLANIEDTSVEGFRKMLEINTVGAWLGIREVIPAMKEAGGGSIINISSVEGIRGAPALSAYSASKFAIRGLTKVAASELGRFGIRVNSIHPGAILTDMIKEASCTSSSDSMHVKAFLKKLPLGRFGTADEISKLVLFLASDESSYSTGNEFIADGGLLTGNSM